MKILYYSPHPGLNLQSVAGYGTHMREMIAAFRNTGHEVLPVIMGGTEPVPLENASSPSDFKSGIKAIVPNIAWETAKDFQLLRKDKKFYEDLKTEIIRFKPELIYERANCLQLSGTRAAKEAGIKHILEVNAPLCEEHYALGHDSWLKGKARKIEREQLSGVTKVAVVSKRLQDYFEKEYKIPASQFIVTPNAIDPEKIKLPGNDPDFFGRKTLWRNEFVVGFVGSIFPWHGVDRLIRAFAEFRKENLKAKLLIVGSGYVLPELKSLAKNLLPVDSYFFTGNVRHSEVFQYISGMNVTVLPNSHWYGSPVKLFEYGAMGKAIIAIGNDPVKEVFCEVEDGMLISTEEKSLVEALQFMFQHPVEREKMAQTFQRKVLGSYTWEKTAKKLIESVF